MIAPIARNLHYQVGQRSQASLNQMITVTSDQNLLLFPVSEKDLH